MLKKIYDRLLREYGPQGWWPLLGYEGINFGKSGAVKGYHVEMYDFPRNNKERFEIMCGALLTQNTSWVNVEKALFNLRDAGLLDAENILIADVNEVKRCVRPAGYYNQKADRLKILAEFFLSLGGRVPGRDELLAVKGIGKETCDSILLYAYGVLVFVVDLYTRRIFESLGLVEVGSGYEEIREFFESGLKRDIVIYQEYHALLVEHAKRFYVGVNRGENDFLRGEISL